ncbi:unnamed protein product [Linum trigynum]|uniref:Uncharacterized protein n=1 Tax=Linum trigynum TaxID=586398 RepID=A0AAV2CH26_9ROSI
MQLRQRDSLNRLTVSGAPASSTAALHCSASHIFSFSSSSPFNNSRRRLRTDHFFVGADGHLFPYILPPRVRCILTFLSVLQGNFFIATQV